jgi:undecaprenyl-diphosphatase
MDLWLIQFLISHRLGPLDHLAYAMKGVGESSIVRLEVVALVAVVGVRGRRWAWGLGVALAAGAALVVADVAKAVVDRPRPPEHLALVPAPGSSMPSSVALLCAAMGMAAVAGWDRRGRPRRWDAALAVASVVAAFGWAVVYLGVHWPSDVLVGWAMGAVVGVAAVAVGRWLVAVGLGAWPGLFAELDRWARPAARAAVRSDAVGDAEEA